MPTIRQADFRAGLYIVGERGSANPQPDFTIPQNALLRADDIEYLESGGVRGRRPFVKYDNQNVGGPVVGMFRHYPRRGPIESGDASCIGISDNSLFGGTDWTTPGLSGQRDGLPAQCPLTNVDDESAVLRIIDPYRGAREVQAIGAVTGIVVEIHRRSVPNTPQGAGMRDLQVQFALAGAEVGDDKADLLENWTREYQTKTYGAPGDLWGRAWTVGELNNCELWIRCKASLTIQQADIDFVDIHVYVESNLAPTFLVGARTINKVFLYRPNVDGGGAGWNQLEMREEPTSGGAPPAPVNYVPPFETDYRPRFVSWLSEDRTYIWDGANRVIVFDGTYLQPGPSAAPRGPYAWLHKARLWATDPNELNFSVYGSGVNDPDDWTLGRSHLNVADTRGGVITGGMGIGDLNVIFKDSGLWNFEGDVDTGGKLMEFSETGAVAPESITPAEWVVGSATTRGAFFVGAESVYFTTGLDVIDVGLPLRALFVARGANTLYRDAIAVYYPLKKQLLLKLDPLLDEGWVCQIITGEEGPLFAWSRRPVLLLNAGCNFSYSPDSGEIMAGSIAGFVRQLDVPTVKLDEGTTAITCRVQTPYARLAPAGVHGRATHLKTIARHQVLMDATILYDEGETQVATGQIGKVALLAPDIQRSRVWISSLAKLGHTVSADISNVGDSFDFELHEVQIDTQLRRPRRWQP